jgi:hypothetical protein
MRDPGAAWAGRTWTGALLGEAEAQAERARATAAQPAATTASPALDRVARRVQTVECLEDEVGGVVAEVEGDLA